MVSGQHRCWWPSSLDQPQRAYLRRGRWTNCCRAGCRWAGCCWAGCCWAGAQNPACALLRRSTPRVLGLPSCRVQQRRTSHRIPGRLCLPRRDDERRDHGQDDPTARTREPMQLHRRVPRWRWAWDSPNLELRRPLGPTREDRRRRCRVCPMRHRPTSKSLPHRSETDPCDRILQRCDALLPLGGRSPRNLRVDRSDRRNAGRTGAQSLALCPDAPHPRHRGQSGGLGGSES